MKQFVISIFLVLLLIVPALANTYTGTFIGDGTSLSNVTANSANTILGQPVFVPVVTPNNTPNTNILYATGTGFPAQLNTSIFYWNPSYAYGGVDGNPQTGAWTNSVGGVVLRDVPSTGQWLATTNLFVGQWDFNASSNPAYELCSGPTTTPVGLYCSPGNNYTDYGTGTFSATYGTNFIVSTNLIPIFSSVLGMDASGSTDVTMQMSNILQICAASNVVLNLPPGSKYLVQEITLPSNSVINANGSHWLYATNAWNTNICVRAMTNHNVIVRNLEVDGQNNNQNVTTMSFTTYLGTKTLAANPDQFVYWQGNARHGVQYYTEDANSEWDNVTVHGFTGAGIIPVGTLGEFAYKVNKTKFSGTAYQNMVGIYSSSQVGTGMVGYRTNWVGNYVPGAADPQYCTYGPDIVCQQNGIGAVGDAENCKWIGSSFNYNFIGMAFFGQADAATVIKNCKFNHGWSDCIYIGAGLGGMAILGCEFRGGVNNAIYINNDLGVVVDNCTWDGINITNVNPSGINIIRNCTYAGSAGHWAAHCNLAASTVFYGNFSYNDSDTDGQAATLIGIKGNGSGLTNIPYTKTVSSTNMSFSFTVNPDGSTNAVPVLTNTPVTSINWTNRINLIVVSNSVGWFLDTGQKIGGTNIFIPLCYTNGLPQ